MSSVDLPMPGSPAISSTEPRTNPPPVTRSNSGMPEGRRGASCASPASGSSANSRPLRGARPGPGGRASTPSSTSVFHSPQASHLPCQRPKAAPQFWQTKLRARRAMIYRVVIPDGERQRADPGPMYPCVRDQSQALGYLGPGSRASALGRDDIFASTAIDAVIAAAEGRQDFVADGAGERRHLLELKTRANQRDEIAAPHRVVGEVADVDGDQVHGDAADHRAAL